MHQQIKALKILLSLFLALARFVTNQKMIFEIPVCGDKNRGVR
jgi:hypothetical protein